MKGKKALIVGSTGLIGSQLISELLASDKYASVTSISRSRSLVNHKKLKQVIINFEKLHKHKEAMEVDDVFCCLGTTHKKAGSKPAFKRVDYYYPLWLAQHAKSAGASQYLLVSSVGANPNSMSHYSKIKGLLEADLQKEDYPSLQIFRPSILTGPRNEFRFGEKVGILIGSLTSPLMLGPMKKYRPIKSATVAKAMLIAANSGNTGVKIYSSDQIKSLVKQKARN